GAAGLLAILAQRRRATDLLGSSGGAPGNPRPRSSRRSSSPHRFHFPKPRGREGSGARLAACLRRREERYLQMCSDKEKNKVL
ncbi:unnamed protein product, partial [Urochloa humidicola]